MAEEMDPATVLEEAADLLLIHGRCKLEGEDGTGKLCVLGAIGKVRGLRHWSTAIDPPFGMVVPPEILPLTRYAAQRLWDSGRPAPPTPAAIYSWNDGSDDDFEIIDGLRHVAKEIRNGEVQV